MTILSESIKNVDMPIGSYLAIIGLIILITAMILLVYDYYISSVICFTIGIIFFIVIIGYFREPHKRIKAIIPDDYSAVSLYDEYIVINREGQIWELEEMEPLKRSDEVEDD